MTDAIQPLTSPAAEANRLANRQRREENHRRKLEAERKRKRAILTAEVGLEIAQAYLAKLRSQT